ncbi:MAG TPA: PQQ-dependent sugar dehydrogenase [Gemmataceae bacterium]|nr:PQQ-dependent sugar dehydrogenase [Gemmataceae bacterium]
MPRKLVFATVLLAVVGVLSPLSRLCGRADGGEGVPARKPWTTSRVVGSPEPPPPYRIERAFPNVKLYRPLLFARIPGSDRVVVAEHERKVYSFRNQPDATPDLFFDPMTELKTLNQNPGAKGVETVYGLVFHPRFAENRECFVCYTLKGKNNEKNLADGTRVSRFKVTRSDPPRLDPDSEEILLTWLQGGHNGGDVHFGRDSYLYISTGDATDPNPPDLFKTGQDISDLLSSVLRIDVDRKDPAKNYAVPKDNPFVDLKDARPEVWAYGFRNPWRMSIDRLTGDLWVADVGWELWESVNRVERGGNYGWSIMEARQPVNVNFPPGPTPIRAPLIDLPHSISASVTGGYVYRGTKFPELAGAYIFGDYETKRVWAARAEKDRLLSMVELIDPAVRLSAMGEDDAGELYFLDYDLGTINVLVRNPPPPATGEFPRTLSATGIFASVRDQQPAEGVTPFSVTAAQWSDGATAKHWLGLPGTSQVTWHPRQVQIPGAMFRRLFEFPENAALVKTLSLELERGNPASRRNIETQLLHTDGRYWRGYTYAWNDAQTDATLVPADGGERVFTVTDSSLPGGKREHVWTFHSRTQCLQCHTPWAETALGFNVAQLNRDIEVGPSRMNQLAAFEAAGVIRHLAANNKPAAPLTSEYLAKQQKLVDPYDAGADAMLRARSYLNTNCGHCHRFGGGGAVDLELIAFSPVEKLKAVDVRPYRGDFGLPDARIIAAGDPYRSTLYYRMSKFGRDRMPHLGSEWPDETGLAVVHDWITSLPASTPRSPGPPRPSGIGMSVEEIAHGLGAPANALAFARAVGRNSLPAATRDQVLAAAAALPAGPVRDLFDGYLPHTGARKLGPNPRPAAILALTGDAERGKVIFWTKETQCQTCHKIGEQGTVLGPDLSHIGKDRTRPELLESLLEPSRRVEPQYVAYLATTTGGKQAQGILVKKDASEVVLRDAKNEEVRFKAAEVESLVPARQSLMPDGLLRDMTAQQAADLLEYLATRK